MTDPSGHLDLDALADVLAGEREEPHLRSCRQCADRLAELTAADASVTAVLTSLPAPPLPAGLPLRLARALQDERQRELAAVRAQRRRTPAWLSAVAASAVLGTAGVVGWSLLDPSGQDAATSDAGGGAQDTAAAPEAAAGLALPRTDWADPAARRTALSRLLTTDLSASSASPVPTGDGLDRLRDPAALSACLAGLPGSDDDVLAVDFAQHAGVPAVAVVQAAEPGSVRVTVVGSGCSAGEPDLLAQEVLPRP